MKKLLLTIFSLLALLAPAIVKADSWIVADTVVATVDSNAVVEDTVIVAGSTSYILKWRVIGSNFPSDWLTEAALGICDNNQCYNNTGTTNIWNGLSGSTFTSNAYTTGDGDFHLALNLTGASTGTHYITVNFADQSLNNKTTTFIITKPVSTSVPTVARQDDVILYPNPAHDEVNVVYDQSLDVKNITVYNIIGKVLAVYKVTNNNSANLNLENIPSGFYFLRLVNSHGDVVVTRKFTKQ